MSIFPTKVLLATDGSEDAQLAAKTAVDLSKKLDSELHELANHPDLTGSNPLSAGLQESL